MPSFAPAGNLDLIAARHALAPRPRRSSCTACRRMTPLPRQRGQGCESAKRPWLSEITPLPPQSGGLRRRRSSRRRPGSWVSRAPPCRRSTLRGAGDVTLVEDDDRPGTCRLGVGRLESEAATSALDQRDASGDEGSAKSSGPPGSGTMGAPTAASVKSPSQPLVFARGGARLMSIGVTCPGDVAEAAVRERRRSRSITLHGPVSCRSSAGNDELELERVERDVVARPSSSRPGDVRRRSPAYPSVPAARVPG